MNSDDDGIQPRQTLFAQGGIPAIQRFESGHLVTAEDLNELVAAIKELDRRLRALE